MEYIVSLPSLEGGRIFDTHAHYDDSAFDGDRDELLNEMHRYGVGSIITCGCDEASSKAALELAHKHPFIYAAVGVHPECTKNGYDEDWIRRLAADEKCVAIGEIGLDYHWSEPNERDKSIFESQLTLAKELEKPVILHDREAHGDTFDILKKHRPRGVMHCYSGSAEMAHQLVDMGLYIGLGGVLTFKNARKTVEVAEQIPLERILLETDAPYMAPVPLRSRRCHSAMIVYVAERLAQIKGVTLKEVLDVTYRNAQELFGISED